eukprot:TRINITY_DN1229_c0_g1_i1.p1 TRINITY_DN1229_c0_g1~~TRINITY_DN1229_c0_g1_i1.p1  ORF type:complete len:272 (+),score=35.63 TRINITY_DN1229_c0_g1_i1:55-870(+)
MSPFLFLVQRHGCFISHRMAPVLTLLLVAPRWRVATGTVGPRPSAESQTPCDDPATGASGYEPVCPPGYYKCCASCLQATCYGTQPMEISWRGIPECIPCGTGDYCEGCDTFRGCPASVRKDREGDRVSRAMSTRLADCETCPPGMEAAPDQSECVPEYAKNQRCDKEFVKRCMRNCESPDPKRRKQLTDCEKMKCEMYCAKLWSDDCAAALSPHCRYKTQPLNRLTQKEFEQSEGIVKIQDCDVDCSGAPLRVTATSLSFVAVLFAALTA